jgi:hypothetical protein
MSLASLFERYKMRVSFLVDGAKKVDAGSETTICSLVLSNPISVTMFVVFSKALKLKFNNVRKSSCATTGVDDEPGCPNVFDVNNYYFLLGSSEATALAG